jgi:hypothetical protein
MIQMVEILRIKERDLRSYTIEIRIDYHRLTFIEATIDEELIPCITDYGGYERIFGDDYAFSGELFGAVLQCYEGEQLDFPMTIRRY